jgi:hypothetical protein
VLVPVVLVAGLALLVGLFFVFRGGSDDETAATPTTETTATEGTTEAATTEAATTEAETTEAATTGESPGSESTFLVIVRDGKPAGGVQHFRAAKGSRIVLRVESDVEDEVHVHGYDLMLNVAPGKPVRFRFTASIVGRFEIELEDAGTPIAELEVR